jgi:hypothetical protein
VSDYSWLDDLELTSLVQEAMEDERSTIFRSPVRRSRRYAPRTSRPRVSVEAYLLKAHREKVGQLLRDVVKCRIIKHPVWANKGFVHSRNRSTVHARLGSLGRRKESMSLPTSVRETLVDSAALENATLDELSLQSLQVDPSPTARIHRGFVHFLAGRARLAAEAYGIAARETASPLLATLALNNAADSLVAVGATASGLELYDRARRVSEAIPEVYFGILITAYRLGDAGLFARASIEVDRRFEPTHPSVASASFRWQSRLRLASSDPCAVRRPRHSPFTDVGETTATILCLT